EGGAHRQASAGGIPTGAGNVSLGASPDTSVPWSWTVNGNGHLIPQNNGTWDIGDPTHRVRNVFVGGAVAHRTKAGTPTDADVTTPTDGMMIIDTTASKIWCRIAGTWKATVALT